MFEVKCTQFSRDGVFVKTTTKIHLQFESTNEKIKTEIMLNFVFIVLSPTIATEAFYFFFFFSFFAKSNPVINFGGILYVSVSNLCTNRT